MNRKLLIRDVTLRDGQQSLFATRMKQEQIDRVLPLFRKANFYAMEVWGGAVPDSVMRYLNENPWERLKKIKEGIGDISKLTALSRGRNLFGYNPYPEAVIEGFNRNAIAGGIDIMRIFDALNDVENMKSTIKYVKENGGIADCTICYTIDPKFTRKEKIKALLKRKHLPNNVFTNEYFINLAKQLEELGADIITLKDMAGLIPPGRTGRLIQALKSEVSIPINFHTHCTPGYGLAAMLSAIVNGVDIVDTAILPFSGGPAAPAYEIIQIFCNKLKIDTNINKNAVVEIDQELRKIRDELADFDSYKMFPTEIDITKDKLPVQIDKLFNFAIGYAKTGKEEELLDACHKIEKYFNFPEPNEYVKNAEIPGGMYTNMLAQLKQLGLEKLLNRVLELVPVVRVKAGCPPLVTPTSQIVGVQAVNCVIDENKGDKPFTTKSTQFVNLVKGLYGKTPIQIDPEFRKEIAGVKKEVPFNPKSYKKQENPVYDRFGNIPLAKNEQEELLLELFPSVAKNFLYNSIEHSFYEEKRKIEEDERQRFMAEKEKYESMSEEEKKERLLKGLYHYTWTSSDDKQDDNEA